MGSVGEYGYSLSSCSHCGRRRDSGWGRRGTCNFTTSNRSTGTSPCSSWSSSGLSNKSITDTSRKIQKVAFSIKETIKKYTKKVFEKSRVVHPRQRKKCANLYLKKAGSHPVASLKYCTIKINYRHKKQKMSDGEYGYSIGPSPPGSALAWCCQTPPATRLTRPPPGTSAPPVSRSS